MDFIKYYFTFMVCDDKYPSAPIAVSTAQTNTTTNILTYRLCMAHKAIQFYTTVVVFIRGGDEENKMLYNNQNVKSFVIKLTIDVIIINHTKHKRERNDQQQQNYQSIFQTLRFLHQLNK